MKRGELWLIYGVIFAAVVLFFAFGIEDGGDDRRPPPDDDTGGGDEPPAPSPEPEVQAVLDRARAASEATPDGVAAGGGA